MPCHVLEKVKRGGGRWSNVADFLEMTSFMDGPVPIVGECVSTSSTSAG